MKKTTHFIVSSLFVLFASGAAADEPEKRDFSTYQPIVEPSRIERHEAPKIDGKLDEDMWKKAAVLSEFYQVEPNIGKPQEDTVVYLAYDSRNLYIGVQAFDKNPDKILKSILQRDGDTWRDDMIRFYIDPFATGLSGFAFDVNALGTKLDRLLQQGRAPNVAWDTIWDAKAQITDKGWTAEIAIPFRSISFNPDGEGWNLMVTREISHKGEEVRWAAIDNGIQPWEFRRPGKLKGIKDIDKGLGLDVELQGKISASRDWERPRDDDLSLDGSANIYYKINPALVGLLTVNADFSDTPLDTRQINTGRFSLFRDETRDFFLQDASIFEFAGETFIGAPNGQPFFSRRIGLVNGEAIDLKFGAKLSGELAGFDVGLLTTHMGETSRVDAQTLSVARISKDLFGHSRLGLIATNGDPTGKTENTLIGVDYLFQDKSFFGGLFQADIFYQSTFTDSEDDDSFGARIDYPNNRWNWTIAARQIGEDFRPALGFVNRPGTRDYTGQWRRRFRPTESYFLWYQFGTDSQYVTDLDGNTQSRVNSASFEFQNRASDEVKFKLTENREVVTLPFSLPKGIIIPAGDYQNNGASFDLVSSFYRSWGLNAFMEYKDFFDGDNFNYKVTGLYRPSPYWNVKVQYEREEISVPNGDVAIQIGSVDGVVNFSPDISVSLQMQYDNISESFSIFSRTRWEIRPQTELFVSLGHGAIIQTDKFPRDFESVQTQLVLRLGNRFQF